MDKGAHSLFELTFPGGTKRPFYFRGNSVGDKGVIEQIFKNDDYNISNFPMTAKLKLYANAPERHFKKLLVVDAGANIGASSIYFTLWDARICVCAIEPENHNFELLQKNCADLPIVPLKAALAGKCGKLWVSDPGLSDWGFRVGHDQGQHEVDAIDMPHIFQKFSEEHYSPLLCKIDIEGGEEYLFSENCNWIDKFPLIIIELHDWMLPGTNNSRNFLAAIAERRFDVIYRGENLFCFNNAILQAY